MTYILIIGALLLGGVAFFAFNKKAPENNDRTEIVEGISNEKKQMTQDTITADYSYAITAHGKINDVIFAFTGVRKKEVEGKMIDHIKIDVDEFIYAKEGDVVKLADNLTIKIIKITNPPQPQIGKVYFDVLK